MDDFKEAHTKAANFNKLWTIVLIGVLIALIVATLLR